MINLDNRVAKVVRAMADEVDEIPGQPYGVAPDKAAELLANARAFATKNAKVPSTVIIGGKVGNRKLIDELIDIYTSTMQCCEIKFAITSSTMSFRTDKEVPEVVVPA